MREPCAYRQRGYTLIEVIVAFALLALALTLLLGALSGGARQVRWSGDAGRAALHAQSLMDQVGIVDPVEAGQRSGDFEGGRYRWRLGIERWSDPSALNQAPQLVDPAASVLYEVTLAVEWGDGGPRQRLDLQTLRMVQGGMLAELP